MRPVNAARTAALMAGVGLGLMLATPNAQASALVLSSTPSAGDTLDMKFGGYTAADPGVPTGDSGGQETTWGIGYLSEIDDLTAGNTRIWNGDGANPQNTSVEFVLYGVADKSYTPGSPGTLQNVGCTVGPGCDGQIHIDFYTVDGTDPARSSVTTSDRTGFSTVNGITNVGTPLMDWVLVPGDINDTGDTTTTLTQDVNSDVLPTTGTGDFLADCVSGPGCSLFKGDQEQLNGLTDLFGDLLGLFTLQTCTSSGATSCPGGDFPNGFEGFINDPVQAVAAGAGVPEPSSLALIGVGMLLVSGIGVHKTRRKN